MTCRPADSREIMPVYLKLPALGSGTAFPKHSWHLLGEDLAGAPRYNRTTVSQVKPPALQPAELHPPTRCPNASRR